MPANYRPDCRLLDEIRVEGDGDAGGLLFIGDRADFMAVFNHAAAIGDAYGRFWVAVQIACDIAYERRPDNWQHGTPIDISLNDWRDAYAAFIKAGAQG